MKVLPLMTSLMLATGIVACATPPTRTIYRDTETHYYQLVRGRITDIERIEERGGSSGVGAIVGGIVGGIAGHQIGQGRGNTAATAAGAIGGAVIGNQVEKRGSATSTHFQVYVSMDNGERRHFKLPALDGLRVGDRVIVDHDRLIRD